MAGRVYNNSKVGRGDYDRVVSPECTSVPVKSRRRKKKRLTMKVIAAFKEMKPVLDECRNAAVCGGWRGIGDGRYAPRNAAEN